MAREIENIVYEIANINVAGQLPLAASYSIHAILLYVILHYSLKRTAHAEETIRPEDIKQMERAVQEMEAKYLLITQNSMDLIRVWNDRGEITYASPSHESVLGHSPMIIQQYGILQFTHPEDAHLILDFVQKIRMINQPYEFEFRIRHQNGEWLTFETKGVPVFNHNGEIFQILSVSRDITHRKQMERELKITKDQLVSLIQHTADAILVCDKDGSILLVNPAAERIYGWSKQELLGKNFREFYFTTEYYTQTLEFLQHVLTTGQVVTYDAVCQHKDGSSIYLNTTLSPVPDESGSITAVAAITRDVKERKLAEDSLMRVQQELHNTIHNLQGIIFKVIKDEKGRFVHTLFDGQLVRELNITSDQIVNRDFNEAFSPKIVEFILPFNQKAWQGEATHYEINLQNRDLLVTLRPVFQGNKVIEVVGSCVDVTRLKLTEDLLKRSEKLAMIGQLAAGIAHEIRNPLTTLKGFMQLYQKKLENGGFTFMDLMLSEIERIERITEEFLTLSKPKSRKIQDHDLAKILEHVKNFITPQAMLNNVEIRVEWDSSIPKVLCDENSIKQLMINLLKNAIESMPEGGLIQVIGLREQTGVEIRIQDGGCGIPEDRIAHLGEPFYSLKEKGTGLGLMICFKIVEEHQGIMRITSEVGKGTMVTVSLPYKEDQSQMDI